MVVLVGAGELGTGHEQDLAELAGVVLSPLSLSVGPREQAQVGLAVGTAHVLVHVLVVAVAQHWVLRHLN